MNIQNVGLLGAGGFGREVMPIAEESILLSTRSSPTKPRFYFVETTPSTTTVNGRDLISKQAFLDMESVGRFFNVAISDSTIRETIANECIDSGIKPVSITAPSVIAYDENVIGEGAILCANTIITSNTRIGKFFHLNIYSYVAHDCVIGDYVTFSPCVKCNGNVHIHDHAFIGTGAVLKQGANLTKPLVIGRGAVVGMGAVVTKDVEPFTTVVGNPAKVLVKKKS